MAKDFFDEEFEKKTSESNGSSNDGWFVRSAPRAEQTKVNKPTYIAVIAFVLVLCIVFGWVLCTIFQGARFNYNTDGNGINNYGDDILETVIAYLKDRYYLDIDSDKWMQAIEYSGTALMQKAGDRFSMLMSPQTYYDFCYPTSTETSDEMFGVSFSVWDGIGLYVSSVVVNSGAYGKLQEGDIVLRLTDIVGDEDGNAPVVDGVTYDSLVIGDWSSDRVTEVIKLARKANFHVLRFEDEYEEGFKVFSETLIRQKVTPVDSDYPYNFIEFYFDEEHRNVSVPSATNSAYTTYEERCLEQVKRLDGVGYVRITQFTDYALRVNGELVEDNDGKPVMVSAAQEFKKVMDLFKQQGLKYLVLDLKGNPGGNVAYVSDIAGMLVDATKLSAQEKAAVTNKKGELLITTLNFPKFKFEQQHWRSSSYSNYFGEMGDKCNVVLWTDGGSASASELLTGALLDYGTAVQMGVKTYGKGIAQTWEELPFYGTVTANGKEMKVPWAIYYTCANYFSPFGVNIHGEGYTPKGDFNGLTTYAQLWDATIGYWGTSPVEQVG